jgi:hypothetical protein
MSKQLQNNHNSYSGLYLFGRIIDRTRRHVPKDNPTTEIVTYLVQSNRDSKFYVDDYAPDSYYDIGADVSFNVYIKTYKRRNGEPSYTLNIQQNDFSRGEHF